MVEIRTQVLTILWQALCPPSYLISPALQLENNAILHPDKLVFDLLEAYGTSTELDLQILPLAAGSCLVICFVPAVLGFKPRAIEHACLCSVTHGASSAPPGAGSFHAIL